MRYVGIKNGELYEHELPKLTPERSPIEEELDLATFKASFKFTTFAFNNGTILIA
jgi:hypothetical protein